VEALFRRSIKNLRWWQVTIVEFGLFLYATILLRILLNGLMILAFTYYDEAKGEFDIQAATKTYFNSL
jgi:hypothetical protein